jgi:hypothetical protein
MIQTVKPKRRLISAVMKSNIQASQPIKMQEGLTESVAQKACCCIRKSLPAAVFLGIDRIGRTALQLPSRGYTELFWLGLEKTGVEDMQ